MGHLIASLRTTFAALLFPAAAQVPSRRIAALSASLCLVMVACGAEPPVFALAGTIQSAPYLDVDGDTNDPHAPLQANNGATEAEVQALANPVLLNGFVTQGPTGITGTRFASSADVDDVYTAELAQGEYVSLRINDFAAADLDLYLIDPVDYSLAAISINVGEYESLRVPRGGRYFIHVRAVEGASSYVLQLGAESFLADARRHGSGGDFKPYQAIIKQRSRPAQGGASNLLQRAQIRLPRLAVVREQRAQIDPHDLSARAALGLAETELPITFAASNTETRAKLETLKAIKLLRSAPEVLLAEPEFRVAPLVQPADPGFGHQWHYRAIDLPVAWQQTLGEPSVVVAVVVAVVDTGVYLEHPDLSGQWLAGFDFVADPELGADGDGIDPDPSDSGAAPPAVGNWHGTHVAGTVAAHWGNADGGVGVAPGVRLMPLRAMGEGDGSLYDVLQAVRYAAGLPNDSGQLPPVPAHIINLSLGGRGYSQMAQDLLRQVRALGILVVAAVGNDGTDEVLYPAGYEGVVGVGAVDRFDQLTRYSNFGAALDLAAPGGNLDRDGDGDGHPDAIFSTTASQLGGQLSASYGWQQGTSMAAAHVSGVAALMWSVAPSMAPELFEALLAAGELTRAGTGQGEYLGRGIIDANRAVAAAVALTGEPLPPAIALDPAVLALGSAADMASIRVDAGGREVTAAVEASWLGIEQGAEPGLWTVRVVRDGLEPGWYTSQLDFSDTAGGRARLPVSMQVAAPIGPGDAGKLYVTLYQGDSATPWRTVAAEPVAAGRYRYQFAEVPPGSYWLGASSDADYDGVLCEPGEICGGVAGDAPAPVTLTSSPA